MGEMRNAYNIVVRKPEGKRTLGRPSKRWEILNALRGTSNTGRSRCRWQNKFLRYETGYKASSHCGGR
jgi:hypothetical protein